MKRVLLVLLIATLGLGYAAYTEVERRWAMPLAIPEQGFVFEVEPGASLSGVAARLESAGVLEHPELLVAYARWQGTDGQIKQGEYLVPAGVTAAGLLQQLVDGDIRRYQVTLPEGITLQEALAILWDEERLRHSLSGAQDERLLALAKPHDDTEGLFFPDSYQFTRGDSDYSILQRARSRMVEVLSAQWQGRAEGLPLETPYEALILASIVEKETGVVSERRAISGVFTRRLQQRMRLQTDPTVIYGLGAGFDGNLRRSHLKDDSNPYNTYRHYGLPPTPIALPGEAAIHAALHPDDGTALYFVARGDGSHQFSDTLAQHNSAVRKYQLKRRKDYRSTPEKR